VLEPRQKSSMSVSPKLPARLVLLSAVLISPVPFSLVFDVVEWNSLRQGPLGILYMRQTIHRIIEPPSTLLFTHQVKLIFARTREDSESSSVDGDRCHSGVPTNATDTSRSCSGTAEARVAIVVSGWSSDSAHSQECIATLGLLVQSIYRKECLWFMYLVTIL